MGIIEAIIASVLISGGAAIVERAVTELTPGKDSPPPCIGIGFEYAPYPGGRGTARPISSPCDNFGDRGVTNYNALDDARKTMTDAGRPERLSPPPPLFTWDAAGEPADVRPASRPLSYTADAGGAVDSLEVFNIVNGATPQPEIWARLAERVDPHAFYAFPPIVPSLVRIIPRIPVRRLMTPSGRQLSAPQRLLPRGKSNDLLPVGRGQLRGLRDTAMRPPRPQPLPRGKSNDLLPVGRGQLRGLRDTAMRPPRPVLPRHSPGNLRDPRTWRDAPVGTDDTGVLQQRRRHEELK